MRYLAAAFAMCVAACSVETEARRPFADAAPMTYHVEAATYGPGELEVRLLEDRAWVGPTVNWWRSHILWRPSTDRWLATIESQRAAYEKALIAALANRGNCRVTSATPAPSYFAFEFVYTCIP